MASRTIANLGIRVGYSPGEDGWGDAATEDLRKLSILTQPVVFSFVAELPDAPTNGDRHILSAEDSNSGPVGSIIYWDVDQWVYYTPLEGWEVWNIGDSSKYRFEGGVWVLIPGAGTLDAYAITYSSGDDGDSNSVEVNVGDALDDLYRRLRLGGASSAAAVSYDSGDTGDSNSVQTTVQAALDDLYSRLRVIDPAFMFAGVGSSENKRASFVATRPFSIPINCVGSQAYAATPVGPTDSNSAGETIVFNIQKNGGNIGTITFEAGNSVGTFAMVALANFAAGDRLSVLAPAALDTLAEVSITFMGSRHV